MLTKLDNGDSLIELAIVGRLSKEDVTKAFGVLDQAFEGSGLVHLFIEVRDFKGLALDAWISDVTHGLRYFTRLKQFGRIAIVSDQSWVRFASRLESAILPFVTYEVFTLDQRDHAMTWAKGEVGDPHRPSLRVLGAAEDVIFTFEVDGRITSEAIDTLSTQLQARFETGDALKLLAHIKRYDGFEPQILVDPNYLKLKIALFKHVSRYAIVGGPAWIAQGASWIDPLLRMDLRHFPDGGEEAARRWLLSGGDQTQSTT